VRERRRKKGGRKGREGGIGAEGGVVMEADIKGRRGGDCGR
jgi:hypothetical protein